MSDATPRLGGSSVPANSGPASAYGPRTGGQRRRPVSVVLLAVLFAALMLSSGASLVDHSGVPAASSVSTPASPVVEPLVAPLSPGASCGSTASGAVSPADAPTAGEVPATDFPVPSAVLYNSQVTPYAVLTGPYAYVAAGAGLRDQGYGKIQLSWPADDSLVAAYMVWSIISNTTPPSTATINGHAVSGTWTAFAEPSPCWGPVYIFTFAADVTTAVVNGANVLTQFPSTNTSGVNPWLDSGNETGWLDDGASLVAIYDAGGSTVHQVTVYTGARTDDGGVIGAELNYSDAAASAATTTYIVADGQLPENEAIWNGTVIQANAFPGSDPKETTDVWSQGNLSDTKTYAVDVPVGSTNITASTASEGGDCFTWTGQVLDVEVAPSPGPYAVSFEEQGLAPGISWNLTIGATTENATSTDSGSSVVFSLPNGTYTYTVTGAPGYSGPFHGPFAVDGGPLFLRLAFHQIVYTITFVETGLPLYSDWWVDLTNLTQPFAQNTSEYSPNPVVNTVSNGTYTAHVGESGIRLVRPAHADVTVDGADLLVTEPFILPPLYNVTFREQGLYGGTSWGGRVDANLGVLTFSGTSPTAVLELPNASRYTDYLYPAQPTGYSVSTELTFGVFGANRTVLVNYTPVYTVSLAETGLPKDTDWEGSLTGSSGTLFLGTDGRFVNLTVGNGSYTFTIEPVWGYLAEPSTGPVSVDGADVSVPISFVPAPTYRLNFTETGLPPGLAWSVRLHLPNGTNTVFSSTAATLSIAEPNGSYSFFVLPPTGWSAAPTSGVLTLAGHNLTEPIAFSEVFRVVLTEVGLPTGAYWELTFNDAFGETQNQSVIYWEPNGSYSFDVYTVGGFVPTPSSGTLVVSDAGASQTIDFRSATEPVYNVTFTETGLPAGTNWTVELGGFYLVSAQTSINFTEPNNTWYYYVEDAGSYAPTPEEAPVTVDGANVTVAIVFTLEESTYTVTFTETGLPSGTTWWANITAGAATSSATTSVATELADGAFPYTIGSDDRRYAAAPGTVTVDGAAASVSVTFHLVVYAVTFAETGLLTGTAWWVNGSSGLEVSSSGTSAVASLPNGSYTFAVASANKIYAAPGGEFSVTGAVVRVSVTFHEVTYAVTFTETGLPSGALWWVNITGGASTEPEGSSTTLYLTNGSYSYTTGTNASGLTKPGGSIHVHGAAVSVSITFAPHTGSGTGSFLGLAGDDGYYALGGVGAAILIAFLLFFAAERRRRKKKGNAAGTPTSGTAPGTPPSPPAA